MRHLLACLVLVGLTAPVAACLNDIELPAHEREFRSQYRGTPSKPTPPPNGYESVNRLLAVAGVALLAGAPVLVWVSSRPRR